MKRKHTSYKLKDDSLENEIQGLQFAARQLQRAKLDLKAAQVHFEACQESLKLSEKRVIEIMKAQHKTEVVVERVKYTLKGNELVRELILD